MGKENIAVVVGNAHLYGPTGLLTHYLDKGAKVEIQSDLWGTIQKDYESLVNAFDSISRQKRIWELKIIVTNRLEDIYAHSPGNASKPNSETIENKTWAIWNRIKDGKESRESALQTFAIENRLPRDNAVIKYQLKE